MEIVSFVNKYMHCMFYPIRMAHCPLDCSGHGHCNIDDNTCLCHEGWMGSGCDMPSCPNNCSSQPCLAINNEVHKSCICDTTQSVGK